MIDHFKADDGTAVFTEFNRLFASIALPPSPDRAERAASLGLPGIRSRLIAEAAAMPATRDAIAAAGEVETARQKLRDAERRRDEAMAVRATAEKDPGPGFERLRTAASFAAGCEVDVQRMKGDLILIEAPERRLHDAAVAAIRAKILTDAMTHAISVDEKVATARTEVANEFERLAAEYAAKAAVALALIEHVEILSAASSASWAGTDAFVADVSEAALAPAVEPLASEPPYAELADDLPAGDGMIPSALSLAGVA